MNLVGWLRARASLVWIAVLGLAVLGAVSIYRLPSGIYPEMQFPRVQVVAVEPLEPLHGLEGLKHMPSSFVPAIYREPELDRKLSVPTDAGWAMAERLASDAGLFLGHSGGAAVAGALEIAREVYARGEAGVVVTVLPDRADRYFEPTRWDEKSPW